MTAVQKLRITLIIIAIIIPVLISVLQRPALSNSLAALENGVSINEQPKQEPIVVQPAPKPQKIPVVKEEPKKKATKTPKKKVKPVIVLDPSHQEVKNLSMERVSSKSTERSAKQLASASGVLTHQKEYRVTMMFAKELRHQLEKKGYKVVLTRTKHDVDLSNRQRATFANKQHAALVISLHADGGKNYQRGFYVMSPTKEAVSKKRYHTSKKQAERILRAVAKEDKIFSDGHFYRDDLALFNFTTMPVISLQLGFLTNVNDDKKLANDRYIHELAKWVSNGIPIAK